jgi:hypothetical protein
MQSAGGQTRQNSARHTVSSEALDVLVCIAHLNRPPSHRHSPHTRGPSLRPCDSLYRPSPPSAVPALNPRRARTPAPTPPRLYAVSSCSPSCPARMQATGTRPARMVVVWHGARRPRWTRPPCTRHLPPSFPSRPVSGLPSPRDRAHAALSHLLASSQLTASDIIPFPAAEPPTPPSTLTPDQQTAAKRAVGILDDEIRGQATAQHLKDTLAQLQRLLHRDKLPE